MNSLIISRIIRNIFWVLLALALCTAPQLALGSASPINWRETSILCLIIFLSALLIDSLAQEDNDASQVTKNITILLLASLALFLTTEWFGLFVEDRHLALKALALFVLLRFGAYAVTHWRYPGWMGTKVLLFGDGPSARKTVEIIAESKGRYILSESVPFTGNERDASETQEELLSVARNAGVSMIIVSFPERRGVMPVHDMLRCKMHGISVVEATGFYEQVTRKLYIENLTPSWFIFSRGFRFSTTRLAVKRGFDIALSLVGLCLLLPVFPLIALLVRCDSPGPVFFRQVRVGQGGALFDVIKFRTMRADAEKGTGPVWAGRHDPRVTRVGFFLRKTRLDEIPQLLNVLAGDMSLVGPRPERPEFIAELEKDIPFYAERHAIKPGLTGWAQIRYPYGASVTDALEKLRYDLYYIKHHSLLFDLEITLRTIPVVIFGRGAR